eukprot:TRINITY_DN1044_c2_g2_i1.p1 TRINITY_DN1044_c2_g2~~TRINITY_DN1044_c2_g2_i1.p1  ORF type:complete len:646 (-),score=223.71 TRINITY_DN1044_c2_g2_i1:215-2152(-)
MPKDKSKVVNVPGFGGGRPSQAPRAPKPDGGGGGGGASPAIWLSQGFGKEEDFLAALEDKLGRDHGVVISGGSTGNFAVTDGGFQFCNDAVVKCGVAAMLMNPSCAVSNSFDNGYLPGGKECVVTRCEGRIIYELDGKPAAQVYNSISGGAFDSVIADGGGSIIASCGNHVFGRPSTENEDGDQIFTIIHPGGILADGGLQCFAKVFRGEKLRAMVSTHFSRRVKMAIMARVSLRRLRELQPLGHLFSFCISLPVTQPDGMPAMGRSIAEILRYKPMLGASCFGEQGQYPDGTLAHGNVTLSIMTFHTGGAAGKAPVRAAKKISSSTASAEHVVLASPQRKPGSQRRRVVKGATTSSDTATASDGATADATSVAAASRRSGDEINTNTKTKTKTKTKIKTKSKGSRRRVADDSAGYIGREGSDGSADGDEDDDDTGAPRGAGVAIAFSKMDGLDRFLSKFPGQATIARDIYFRVAMGECLVRNSGYAVKTSTVGVMTSFPSAAAAARWAVEMQAALATEDWPSELLASSGGDAEGSRRKRRKLTFSVAFVAGSPVARVNPTTRKVDYFGNVVNLTSRILEARSGKGKISTTAETWDAIREAREGAAFDALVDDESAELRGVRDVVTIATISVKGSTAATAGHRRS